MAPDEPLRVEVVYARADVQEVIELALPAGATIDAAIRASGIAVGHPEIGETPLAGIHGRRVSLDTPLRSGDRVEIYRPLVADPKLARRRRAMRSG